MSKIKIKPSIHYRTYGVNSMGCGLISLMDSRKTDERGLDGKVIFAHKLMEDTPYADLTETDRRQIKADCDELVRLLSKFYHEDEYVEE